MFFQSAGSHHHPFGSRLKLKYPHQNSGGGRGVHLGCQERLRSCPGGHAPQSNGRRCCATTPTQPRQEPDRRQQGQKRYEWHPETRIGSGTKHDGCDVADKNRQPIHYLILPGARQVAQARGSATPTPGNTTFKALDHSPVGTIKKQRCKQNRQEHTAWTNQRGESQVHTRQESNICDSEIADSADSQPPVGWRHNLDRR